MNSAKNALTFLNLKLKETGRDPIVLPRITRISSINSNVVYVTLFKTTFELFLTFQIVFLSIRSPGNCLLHLNCVRHVIVVRQRYLTSKLL